MAGLSEFRDQYDTKRLGSFTVPSLHTFFSLSFHSLHRSPIGYRSGQALPVFIVLLGLLLSPLAAAGALRPSMTVAQDVPGSDAGEAIYNSSVGPVFTLPQWIDGGGYLDVVAAFEVGDLRLTTADITTMLRGSSDTTRFTLEAPVKVLPVH